MSVYLVNGELVGLSIKPSYFNQKLTLFLIIIQTCEKQKQIYGYFKCHSPDDNQFLVISIFFFFRSFDFNVKLPC